MGVIVWKTEGGLRMDFMFSSIASSSFFDAWLTSEVGISNSNFSYYRETCYPRDALSKLPRSMARNRFIMMILPMKINVMK